MIIHNLLHETFYHIWSYFGKQSFSFFPRSITFVKDDIETREILMDNKLGLDEREYAYLTAQIIVCGDWHLMKVDKERAFDLLKMFFEAFVPDNIEREVYVNSIYNIVRDSILAAKSYSFEALQLIPSFSEFGRKNMIQLLKFYQEKGAGAFENAFNRMFREGWEERRPDPEIIKIQGGDGKTIETPVRFSTGDAARRIMAESWFIIYHYGEEHKDWERGVHYSVIQPNTNKLISNWNITLTGGEVVDVYFDTHVP